MYSKQEQKKNKEKDIKYLQNNQKSIKDNVISQNTKKAKQEISAAQKLQKYADLFLKLEKYDSSMEQANLIIFYTLKTDLNYIEGLTYKAGACSKNDKFSLIHVSPDDSVFYQAKVTAHEILHSLNGSHKCMSLMDSQGCTTCREDETEISQCTIDEVCEFVNDNTTECFSQVSLCGNGMLDPGEECDSGMPFGSLCCTSNCKLRRNVECDDNNGLCCKDCKYVAKGTMCNEGDECTKKTYCNGASATCPVEYQNGQPCQDGFCKNGVCQTKNLMCQRIGKKFSSNCNQSNSCQLVCVNDNETCSLMAAVYDTISKVITLPDMIPCMVDNKKGMCVKGECLVNKIDYKDVFILVIVILAIAFLIIYTIK